MTDAHRPVHEHHPWSQAGPRLLGTLGAAEIAAVRLAMARPDAERPAALAALLGAAPAFSARLLLRSREVPEALAVKRVLTRPASPHALREVAHRHGLAPPHLRRLAESPHADPLTLRAVYEHPRCPPTLRRELAGNPAIAARVRRDLDLLPRPHFPACPHEMWDALHRDDPELLALAATRLGAPAPIAANGRLYARRRLTGLAGSDPRAEALLAELPPPDDPSLQVFRDYGGRRNRALKRRPANDPRAAVRALLVSRTIGWRTARCLAATPWLPPWPVLAKLSRQGLAEPVRRVLADLEDCPEGLRRELVGGLPAPASHPMTPRVQRPRRPRDPAAPDPLGPEQLAHAARLLDESADPPTAVRILCGLAPGFTGTIPELAMVAAAAATAPARSAPPVPEPR